jgi:hypothetical protein
VAEAEEQEATQKIFKSHDIESIKSWVKAAEAEGWVVKSSRKFKGQYPTGGQTQVVMVKKQGVVEESEEGGCFVVRAGDINGNSYIGFSADDLTEGIAEEKVRLDPKCWKGHHKEGTKIKGGVRVNNCVPNESVDEAANAAQQAAIAINMKKQHKKPKGVNEVAPDTKHLQRHGREADQTWPDDSNSLSKRYNDRDIVVPNLDAVRAGTAPKNKHYQSTPYHTGGVKVATKIKPSITKTTVNRLDKNTNIPNFLKKSGVTESTTKIQESVTTTLTQRMQSVNKKLTTTVKGMD